MRPTIKETVFIAFSMFAIVYTLGAQFWTSHYGRADNGDFLRSMMSYAEKPVGFKENWPVLDPKDPVSMKHYRERFFDVYLPRWVIQTDKNQHANFRHSVHLLWTPGFYLNKALYSKQVLSLKYIGLIPRLLILAVLLAIVLLLYRQRVGLCASIFLIACLALIFSDLYYLSYLNSFYQETGAVVALALMLLGGMLMIHGDYRRSLALFLASLALYGTAKSQYAVASLVLGMLVLLAYNAKFLWSRPLPWTKARVLLTGLGFLAMLGISLYSISVYDPLNAHLCAGQRYFSGVLYFSKDPVKHLLQAGFKPEDKKYIGQYEVPDVPFPASDFLRVIKQEPSVLYKFLLYAADNMHDVKNESLSITPRNAPAAGRVKTVFSSWSELKIHYFPRGAVFLTLHSAIFLATLAALWLVADKDWRRLIFLVLLLNLAVWTEMGACLGDGIMDLPKHLFAANLFFDLQLAVGGFALLQAIGSWRTAIRRRQMALGQEAGNEKVLAKAFRKGRATTLLCAMTKAQDSPGTRRQTMATHQKYKT